MSDAKYKVWLKHMDALVDAEADWVIKMGRFPTTVIMHPLTSHILFNYLVENKINLDLSRKREMIHGLKVVEDVSVGIYNFKFED